jgi:hypothetical protein
MSDFTKGLLIGSGVAVGLLLVGFGVSALTKVTKKA